MTSREAGCRVSTHPARDVVRTRQDSSLLNNHFVETWNGHLASSVFSTAFRSSSRVNRSFLAARFLNRAPFV